MKLIRLATNNDGYFKANFGNELLIEPFSKMALLNLTFETNNAPINITSKNDKITFYGQVLAEAGRSGSTKFLTKKQYTEDEFYIELKNTLNQCLPDSFIKNSPVDSDFETTNSVSSQFIIRNYNNKKRLEFRYSPFINPMYPGSEFFNYDSTQIEPEQRGAAPLQTVLRKLNGIPRTDTTKDNFVTSAKFSAGNGVMLARIAEVGSRAPSGQDNGFGFGLTRTDLPELFDQDVGKIIPLANRIFEIRYNVDNQTYKFINDGAAEADTGVMPFLVTQALKLELHDTLYIKRYDNVIEGGVLQMNNGTLPDITSKRTIFFQHEVIDGADYYPYLYLNGDRTDIAVDMFNVSLDPYVNQGFSLDANEDDISNDDGWQITGLDAPGADFNARSNGVQDVIDAKKGDGSPQPNFFTADKNTSDAFPVPNPALWQDLRVTSELSMDSSIWTELGHENIASGFHKKSIQIGSFAPPPFNICWSWFIGTQNEKLGKSDNFIVESMTLPLDAYDASKVQYSVTKENPTLDFAKGSDKNGRRKNILMTIPDNDNSNNLVEYESNTPIFIDINNKSLINVKNLEFRVLRKDFSVIEQSSESAIMTILIDSK